MTTTTSSNGHQLTWTGCRRTIATAAAAAVVVVGEGKTEEDVREAVNE